jgi:hypothetical protein
VIALLDNTVLSNFSVVERVDLVRRALGEDAATTQAVWDELQTGVRMGRLPAQDWSWLQILSLTEDERAVYGLLTRRLNAGEASCLAIAARGHGGYRPLPRDERDRETIGFDASSLVSGRPAQPSTGPSRRPASRSAQRRPGGDSADAAGSDSDFIQAEDGKVNIEC